MASPSTAAGWKLTAGYKKDGVTYSESSVPPENLQRCAEFEFREGDVVVATYPKAGTNWVGEMASLIMNDAQVEQCRQTPLGRRFVYLEFTPPGGVANTISLASVQTPRLTYTHLFPDYLSRAVSEGKVKVIVVLRNPRDTLVSYYHFYRITREMSFPGTWDEFFELVKAKELLYGDIFQWDLAWWALKDLPNVHVVKYEDLKRDSAAGICSIGDFLGKQLSPADVEKLCEATSFSSMKASPSTNMKAVPGMDHSKGEFMRKGQVGDWKNHFNAEQEAYIKDEEEAHFTPAGIRFEFE